MNCSLDLQTHPMQLIMLSLYSYETCFGSFTLMVSKHNGDGGHMPRETSYNALKLVKKYCMVSILGSPAAAGFLKQRRSEIETLSFVLASIMN